MLSYRLGTANDFHGGLNQFSKPPTFSAFIGGEKNAFTTLQTVVFQLYGE